MALPKELVLKQNNFQKPNEVLNFLKESFKDILQEMLEAEMDCHLGYSKNMDGNRFGVNS